VSPKEKKKVARQTALGGRKESPSANPSGVPNSPGKEVLRRTDPRRGKRKTTFSNEGVCPPGPTEVEVIVSAKER